MTFVAQPYEQFVDDLLTALTGGMVREEHLFVGIEEPYSLASPDAIPFSVRVVGQRNETFALFEGGVDYDYDSEEEVIRWNGDGRLPDDHSYFFVNYYLAEGRRRLTDRNPGSVTTILAESFAREFAVLHKQMEMIYRSAFVDLAQNRSLDHVAALLGLSRRDAKFANGEVLFKRSTPAAGDIAIPAGTLVSTDEGQNLQTTEKRTLRKGQLSVVVPIRAQVEGPPGRVEAGLIKNINRPIFGIESVVNEGPTFFATRKETDEEFRRRVKASLERAGKATKNAIKYGLIEAIPEITEGNIQVKEGTDTPGLVEVKLGLEFKDDADLVRRVEEAIFEARPAGVRVTHNLPTRTLSAEEELAESLAQATAAPDRTQGVGTVPEAGTATSLEPRAQAAMPEGVLRLRTTVFLDLAEANLSGLQKEQIADDVRQRVVGYVESLPMGSNLIYNKLLGLIVQPDEIADAQLVLGTDPVSKSYTGNLDTDGRKATIDPANVVVELMRETVHVDVGVTLEPTGAAAQISQTLDTEIRTTIQRVLAEAATELTRTRLHAEIKKAVDGDEQFQLVANGAIVMNAEYEETGRLLNNTTKVDLETHQVARLRDLALEVQGALDG
jgi:hypothetical protein